MFDFQLYFEVSCKQNCWFVLKHLKYFGAVKLGRSALFLLSHFPPGEISKPLSKERKRRTSKSKEDEEQESRLYISLE